MIYPPGPRKIHQLLISLWHRQRSPLHFYENIFKKYGDLVFIHLGKMGILMVNDPDVAEQVLHREAKLFEKSSAYERFKVIFGDGLLVSNGRKWRQQRQLMSPAFSHNHIKNLYPLLKHEIELMLKRWYQYKEIDLALEMNRVTLKFISKSMLGELTIQQEEILRDSIQAILSYLQTARHLWIQLFVALLPIKKKSSAAIAIEKILPSFRYRKFQKAIDQINLLVDSIIQKRRELKSHSNLLDQLIMANNQDSKSQMSDQQLRDEVINILIAGHETTANALTWTLLKISNDSALQEELYQELRSVNFKDSPNFEQLDEMKKLESVFSESLRLFPPFWRISRKALCDIKIKNYHIPAGTNIIISIFELQRHCQFWHRPKDFILDRFLHQPLKHRYAYLPFGSGPRVCIGQLLAQKEAMSIMASCLKSFKLLGPLEKNPEILLSLTMQPKNVGHIKLEKRL